MDGIGNGAAGFEVQPRQWTPPVEYAGFWIRFAAFLLDSIFVQLGVFVIALVAGALFGVVAFLAGWSPEMLEGGASTLGFLIGVGGGIGYHVAFLSGAWQATPGKRICGIYVRQEDGSRIGAGRALGRYLSYLISAFTFCVGYMMAGWTAQKTGLHDLICSTRVVHGKP